MKFLLLITDMAEISLNLWDVLMEKRKYCIGRFGYKYNKRTKKNTQKKQYWEFTCTIS
jgi:hypothetical protein